MKNVIIKPGDKLRLVKLWPHAKKQGKNLGQIWEVIPYCTSCGKDVIWLKNVKKNNDEWTIDQDFLVKYFEKVI
jgi:hypothetical protein